MTLVTPKYYIIVYSLILRLVRMPDRWETDTQQPLFFSLFVILSVSSSLCTLSCINRCVSTSYPVVCDCRLPQERKRETLTLERERERRGSDRRALPVGPYGSRLQADWGNRQRLHGALTAAEPWTRRIATDAMRSMTVVLLKRLSQTSITGHNIKRILRLW